MAVVALACDGDGDGAEQAPEPTASGTAAPAPTPVDEEPRTGIPEIDAVLEALFSGDEDVVRALIAYTPTACAIAPEGIGAPPECRDDEQEGDLVDAFATSHCHGGYVRPDDMTQVIEDLATPGPRLRAVAAFDESWPDGDHIVIYDRFGEPWRAYVGLGLVLREGSIAGALYGCGETPEEFLEARGIDDPILFVPPASPTGIRELDLTLEALASGEPDALRPFTRFQGVSCITTPGLGGPPLCRPGEPDGERVEVFPLSTCEQEFRRRDEVADVWERLVAADLYAVYEDGARHVALMESESPAGQPQAVLVFLVGRLIVEADFTCALTPEEALAGVPPDDILIGP